MKKLLDELRASRYGKDAREPIAKALEALQTDFSADKETEAEIQAARSNYISLPRRLEQIDPKESQVKVENAIKTLDKLMNWEDYT